MTSDSLAKLLADGHTLTYAEDRATGGWFADLRDPSGRPVENGNGPTKEAARAHLSGRLRRKEDAQ